MRDHERKKGGRWRSKTTVNWANSLSRRHNLALFFSPYSPYYRSSLVHPIVPSFTHILLLSRARCGRFISYLLNFIKHPGRQHGCIFHFLVSAGIVQKGSVVENGERGDRGVTMSGHSRCLSFFLRRSLALRFPFSLSSSCSPVPAYMRVPSLSFVACFAA